MVCRFGFVVVGFVCFFLLFGFSVVWGSFGFGVFYCLVLIWVFFFCATQAALVREKKIDGVGELRKYDHMAAYPSIVF